MKKVLQSREEFFIQFTDEEIAELGIEKGDKFTVEYHDEGVLLRPYVPVEIDLDEFSIDELKNIIARSLEEDQTIEELFHDAIKNGLHSYELPGETEEENAA